MSRISEQSLTILVSTTCVRDTTSIGTNGSSVVEEPAQHAGGAFSCSRKGIGDWETGGGIGKAVGEGGDRGMSMTGVRNITKFRLFRPISLIFLNLCFVILFRSPSLR